jgi:membrane protein
MSQYSDIKNRFIESSTARELVLRSKKWYLPGFSGLSLYEVWPAFIQQLRKTYIIERASGISFNVVMALPPTLIFAFTLIPYLPISQQFIQELFIVIRDIIPGEKNNSVIISFLDDFLKRPRTGLLSFGLLAAIFFSSNAMMGILRAFDKNYPGFRERKNWQRRVVAIEMTLIMFVLLLVCMAVLIAQGQVLTWLGIESTFWQSVIDRTRWLVICLLLFLVVAVIYKRGPALAKRWPMLTPGAVFATVLMIIATAIVTFWINRFGNYNKLYGSISAIFIIMSLIYINALSILLGFELNVTLTNLQLKKIKLEKQDGPDVSTATVR